MKLPSNSFQEFPFVFPQLGAQSNLEITAFPETNGGTKTVRIRKIRIVETPPLPTFTLSPSSFSIACGSTSAQTFTVTNVNSTPNITNHKWSLGANNGWLYNGSPAPQTISSGTTNTLTLTPVCGVTQSNINASVTANSIDYSTNVCTVSVTAPALTIQGNNGFCSGTPVYNLMGAIPCNATVTWAANPTGIVNLSPNGSSVTVTKTGNGMVNLTASINACNSYSTIKKIAVGTPSRPMVLDEMGNEIKTITSCTSVYSSLCPTVDPAWNILEWEWEKVTGNFNLIKQGSCAKVIGFQPGSGFISVRVRNACGWSNPTLIVVKINDCSNLAKQQNAIRLFPNPAINTVTLSVDNLKIVSSKPNEKENLPVRGITSVKLYDSFGSIKLYRKFNNQLTATLNTSNLPKGIYLLEVNTGNTLLYEQLMIQK